MSPNHQIPSALSLRPRPLDGNQAVIQAPPVGQLEEHEWRQLDDELNAWRSQASPAQRGDRIQAEFAINRFLHDILPGAERTLSLAFEGLPPFNSALVRVTFVQPAPPAYVPNVPDPRLPGVELPPPAYDFSPQFAGGGFAAVADDPIFGPLPPGPQILAAPVLAEAEPPPLHRDQAHPPLGAAPEAAQEHRPQDVRREAAQPARAADRAQQEIDRQRLKWSAQANAPMQRNGYDVAAMCKADSALCDTYKKFGLCPPPLSVLFEAANVVSCYASALLSGRIDHLLLPTITPEKFQDRFQGILGDLKLLKLGMDSLGMDKARQLLHQLELHLDWVEKRTEFPNLREFVTSTARRDLLEVFRLKGYTANADRKAAFHATMLSEFGNAVFKKKWLGPSPLTRPASTVCARSDLGLIEPEREQRRLMGLLVQAVLDAARANGIAIPASKDMDPFTCDDYHSAMQQTINESGYDAATKQKLLKQLGKLPVNRRVG